MPRNKELEVEGWESLFMDLQQLGMYPAVSAVGVKVLLDTEPAYTGTLPIACSDSLGIILNGCLFKEHCGDICTHQH